MSDVAKKKVGRPSKGKLGTFTFRVRADLREKLEAAAAANARSVSEEIEFRLNRDFGWEDAKGDIDAIRRRMLAAEDATYVSKMRAAGLQILREFEGKPSRVIVDYDTLIAEADGIARDFRSGWVDPNAPPKFSEVRTLTEEEGAKAAATIAEIVKPRSDKQ
jgi:hypothetical protein